MTLTPDQLRSARLLLGWTQGVAAEKLSIAVSRVCRVEHGHSSGTTAARLRATYEAAGIEFANDGGQGVKLREDQMGSKDDLMTTRD